MKYTELQADGDAFGVRILLCIPPFFVVRSSINLTQSWPSNMTHRDSLKKHYGSLQYCRSCRKLLIMDATTMVLVQGSVSKNDSTGS
jgi:hypothetical protein